VRDMCYLLSLLLKSVYTLNTLLFLFNPEKLSLIHGVQLLLIASQFGGRLPGPRLMRTVVKHLPRVLPLPHQFSDCCKRYIAHTQERAGFVVSS